MSRVPVADLQREFEASGLSAVEVARRIGWTRHRNGRRYADGPRVTRALGYRSYDKSHHYGVGVRTHVSGRTAMAIRAALEAVVSLAAREPK